MLKFSRIFFFTVSLISLGVAADVLKLRADAPDKYVVKKGDTLWDISALYLNSPWNWPKLWGNNLQIADPHWIFPGDVLSLVFDADGNPKLVVNEGKKQVKLSPSKRITPKDQNAIASISLDTIKPYLKNQRIVTETDFSQAPMVLGGDTNTKRKVAGDLIYSQGQLIKDNLYGIYRSTSNEKLADATDRQYVELELTGIARAVNQAGEVTRLTLESSLMEVQQGEKLFPLLDDQAMPTLFHLSMPEQAVNAEILASSSDLREFSKLEVVLINAGYQDSLRAGHVLGIFRQSPTVVLDNGQPVYFEDASKYARLFEQDTLDMPIEKVGDLVVFKVYENASYALVTESKKPLKVGDLVAQPE